MLDLRRTLAHWFGAGDLSIFYDFRPPPYGGANQFLHALRGEFERRGLRVDANTLSRRARGCLFNSFNFDARRLGRLRHPGCAMVHRVDGPVSLYRGVEDGTDARVAALNQALADVTVFQSRYSREAYEALGFSFRSPTSIPNAVDPRIFHPRASAEAGVGRKVRLISVAWSDNARKGGETYRRLESMLDWSRFEYTFVGRIAETFARIRVIPPVGSAELAGILRAHDVYITASLNDPASNALAEALACGLPALYVRSGGHAEIVGEGGLGYDDAEDIPALLERLVGGYEEIRARIRVPSLEDVADRYLGLLMGRAPA
jgi:glycosyltransferase involved in cell wall biosynthesis